MAEAQISLTRVNMQFVTIPIRGTSPLIVHKFSEKSKRQMLDAMTGQKTPKVKKDPEAEYEAAFYRHDDGGYGFPALAFKAAMVSACRFFGSEMTMTLARQCIFVNAEQSKADRQQLVRLEGTPFMREDVVRVGRGGTDLRYRPEFDEWSASLDVAFVGSMLSREAVLSLLEAAGMGVGVGEWRPEKDGQFGTFEVDQTREIVFGMLPS